MCASLLLVAEYDVQWCACCMNVWRNGEPGTEPITGTYGFDEI